MNTYRKIFVVKCPSDGEAIVYKLEIQSRATIMVEKINERIPAEGFQEDIASDMFQMLEPDSLRLSATHQGVEIETVLP